MNRPPPSLDLSLLTGKITFDDLSLLSDQPLASQIDSLKEDLLQVEYGEHLLLDVGWYPEFDKGGAFQVVVIKDRDWGQPQWTGRAKTLAELTTRLTEAQRELHAWLDREDLHGEPDEANRRSAESGSPATPGR